MAVLLGIMAIQMRLSRSQGGPTPFEPTVGVELARSRARESGKPVLVFATADWCGPCRVFKSGTLAQAGVRQAVKELTEPAYLDIDKDKPGAMNLGVRGIPSLILLRGDTIVAVRTGAPTAPDLIAWLRENAKASPGTAEVGTDPATPAGS